jgi:hypothetical protein
MKRIGFIALPLLAVGVALADGMEEGKAAGQPEAAAATQPAQDRMAGPAAKSLPGGDLRHCLDKQTNAAIIRCSETPRKK